MHCQQLSAHIYRLCANPVGCVEDCIGKRRKFLDWED